jgi:hypothetical protein
VRLRATCRWGEDRVELRVERSSSGVRSDISKGGRRMVVAYNGGVCLATSSACLQMQAAPAQTPLLRHAQAEVGGRRRGQLQHSQASATIP